MLRNIASTTRQKLVNSSTPAPNSTQIPGKSILKNRYPIRSNRGQPPFSSDVHSPNFQFNQISNGTESILLPPNLEILQGDLFENPNTNFGHCVSSDSVMAAGIATHFFAIVPRFERHSTKKNVFTARFSYCTFFSTTTELDI